MATREQLSPPVEAETGVEAALAMLRTRAERTGSITAFERLAEREARTVPFPDWLDARLIEVYRRKGIRELYTHQAEAAELVRAGRNVVVVTPTASGKTLCYNLPVLNEILAGIPGEKPAKKPSLEYARDKKASSPLPVEKKRNGGGQAPALPSPRKEAGAPPLAGQAGHLFRTNKGGPEQSAGDDSARWQVSLGSARDEPRGSVRGKEKVARGGAHDGVSGAGAEHLFRTGCNEQNERTGAPPLAGQAEHLFRTEENGQKQSAEKTSGARALYLFPTKALAQDQLAELYQLIEGMGEPVRTFTYDGDTPQDARRAIRARAHIVVSNPDMLHTGILPHHTRWQLLFENLRFVVLDELHTYRGVFGSHVSNVLRRLRRLCRFYGSEPQFICCSATIANPKELAERLLETEVELIDESGAPTSARTFVFYNPPVVNKFLGIRRSYLNESARLTTHFLTHDCHTITFANSRLATELLVGELKRKERVAPGAPSSIRGYRGGYLPGERRAIERGLRSGEVRSVVTTNALELGIDIGSLDTAVLAGYPGTIASTWQRAGRAGRRTGSSAAVLVASSAPLDQFIVQNPKYFFGRSPEHAHANPDNLEILVSHIKCAAFELPLGEGERFGGPDLRTLCAFLAERGFLQQASDGSWHWTNESYPADTVSLRSVSSDNFVIVDTTGAPRVIGEVDFTSALTTLHEKAIYLHEGRQYQVERLDYHGRKAYVRSVNSSYYTDAISYTKVRVLDRFDSSKDENPDMPFKSHGEVDVRTQVVGFKKLKFHTNENVGAGKLELPEQELHTTAYWLTFPRAFLDSLPYPPQERKNGLQALRHALRSIATLLLMCDLRDLAAAIGENTAAPDSPHAAGEEAAGGASPSWFEPNLYLYDNYPGGIGFSQPLFELHDELLEKTLALIEHCECGAGCPSCVGPIGEVGEHGKEVARVILGRLVAS